MRARGLRRLLRILRLSRRSACGVSPGILRLRGMWFVMPRIEWRMLCCDWGPVEDDGSRDSLVIQQKRSRGTRPEPYGFCLVRLSGVPQGLKSLRENSLFEGYGLRGWKRIAGYSTES